MSVKPNIQARAGRGSLHPVVRTPKACVDWNQDEDDTLRNWWGMANGAFLSYRHMADELNRRYHGGKRVRTLSAVSRREGHVVWGKPWGKRPNARISQAAKL